MEPQIKILTADEARTFVAQCAKEMPDIAQVVQERLVDISKLVEELAKLGKNYLDYTTNYRIVGLLTTELTKRGFVVTQTRSVEDIRISWKDKINTK